MKQDFEIHTLDLAFQGARHAIAAYLVEGPRGHILVETGAGSTLEALLERLSFHAVSPGQVEAVLVTHIHLDHAGAAGWWAQRGVRVYVHSLGARHLIDPSRLIESASRIYGDQMNTLWGEILAAPEEKVTALVDGDRVEAAGLALTAWATPGHARHHHIFQLGEVAFVGDAAGIQRPGRPFVELPAPPPEFDLEAWDSTIEVIRSKRLRRIFPTHFGRVDGVEAHLEQFRDLLHATAAYVRQGMESGQSREEIIEGYTERHNQRAHKAGLGQEEIGLNQFSNPLAMSVDGIMRYWKSKGI